MFVNNFSTKLQIFVPKHNPVIETDIKLLEEFIANSKKIVVLTGAGISTESGLFSIQSWIKQYNKNNLGIPDYRSEDVGLYARSNHKPIQYQEFLKSAHTRQRYWARNYVGWEKFSNCKPNETHKFVRDLELLYNKANAVITQNVDSLHYKAGSKNVVELHGTAFRVKCLNCNENYNRFEVQNILKELNPEFGETSDMIRPDGDVEIAPEKITKFHPPMCFKCAGVLKPDIIFFGDNVPRERVQIVKDFVSKSDALLILGSSLTVFSSFRIVLQAVEENKKIAVVNIGPTRADNLINLKISAKCGDILPKIHCNW